MKQMLILFFGLLLFAGCSNDDNVAAENRTAIEAYLQENNLTAQSTDSGLYYIVEQEGNGTFPVLQNKVKVNYKGYQLDGTVFDQNNNITFSLLSVIKGWQEGMRKFSEGGSGKLFIPAHLAYGSSSPSNNQPIIFDVELIEVIE